MPRWHTLPSSSGILAKPCWWLLWTAGFTTYANPPSAAPRTWKFFVQILGTLSSSKIARCREPRGVDLAWQPYSTLYRVMNAFRSNLDHMLHDYVRQYCDYLSSLVEYNIHQARLGPHVPSQSLPSWLPNHPPRLPILQKDTHSCNNLGS